MRALTTPEEARRQNPDGKEKSSLRSGRLPLCVLTVLLLVMPTAWAQEGPFREVRALTGRGKVSSVAFSPDGRLLASGSVDKTIRLWEVATGQEIGRLMGHSKPVRSVAFSPDGRLLASGGDEETGRLWEVSTGQEIGRLMPNAPPLSVAFSPDGRLLASGSADDTVRL